MTTPRSSVLITLRLPHSSARRMNIVAGQEHGDEIEMMLTAVELAGRLCLASGKAISPEAVAGYCLAWQAATETLEGLITKHGKRDLARMVHKGSEDRALWAPRTNAGALKWLHCVLESHFLSQADSPNGVRMPDSAAEGELHTEVDLGELCLANFAQAYRLWLAGVTIGGRSPQIIG